jgi:protein-disulfide isomerase
MADAGDSKSPALHGRVGSTPTSGTTSESPRALSWERRSRYNLRRVTSPAEASLLRSLTARWLRPAIAVLGVLAIAAGCASRNPPPTAATPTGATPAPTPASTATLTRQELIALERVAGSTPPLPHAVEPASLLIAKLGGTPGPSPAHGPEDAPVRVYLFTDFQCPVCPRVVEPLKHLARAYPSDVRIILKQNALAGHGRAARLAAASLAAFRQGKIWEFHDRVFANPRRNTEDDLLALARQIGLDVARFQRDMDDEAVTDQVRYESELAVSIDLAGTPGLVINGRSEKGWGSYMGLETVVKRELERARRMAEGGVPAGRVAYEATRQSGPKGEQLAAALFAVTK